MSAAPETREGTAPIGRRVRLFLRHNSLGLFFVTAFLLALSGQAVAGHAEFNNQLVADGLEPIGFGAYLTTSDFGVDVMENWQSEYLQFFLYIFGTVYLLQRGSPESKELGRAGIESDQDQMVGEHAADDSPRWAAATGWRTAVYSRSLGLVMGTIFLLSFLAQSVTGVAAYNEQQLRQLQAPVSWSAYLFLRGLLEPYPAKLAVRAAWPSPPWPFWPST